MHRGTAGPLRVPDGASLRIESLVRIPGTNPITFNCSHSGVPSSLSHGRSLQGWGSGRGMWVKCIFRSSQPHAIWLSETIFKQYTCVMCFSLWIYTFRTSPHFASFQCLLFMFSIGRQLQGCFHNCLKTSQSESDPVKSTVEYIGKSKWVDTLETAFEKTVNVKVFLDNMWVMRFALTHTGISFSVYKSNLVHYMSTASQRCVAQHSQKDCVVWDSNLRRMSCQQVETAQNRIEFWQNRVCSLAFICAQHACITAVTMAF